MGEFVREHMGEKRIADTNDLSIALEQFGCKMKPEQLAGILDHISHVPVELLAALPNVFDLDDGEVDRMLWAYHLDGVAEVESNSYKGAHIDMSIFATAIYTVADALDGTLDGLPSLMVRLLG